MVLDITKHLQNTFCGCTYAVHINPHLGRVFVNGWGRRRKSDIYATSPEPVFFHPKMCKGHPIGMQTMQKLIKCAPETGSASASPVPCGAGEAPG